MNNFGVSFLEINLRSAKIKECAPTLGVSSKKTARVTAQVNSNT